MAIIHKPELGPDSELQTASQIIDPDAIAVCESVKHRARLRVYAKTGAIDRELSVLLTPEDVDLSAAGYIERSVRSKYHTVPAFRISRAGELKLFQWTQAARTQRAPHHGLGTQLATWLRASRQRVTWENSQFEFRDPSTIQLLTSSIESHSTSVLRPDVFSIVATLDADRMAPQVHEVKVSRSDFLRDVADASKRASYFRMAPQVFYAAPQGMVSKTEVPKECGLVEQLADGSWKTTRNAPLMKKWPGLSPRQWLAMVLKPHLDPHQPDL